MIQIKVNTKNLIEARIKKGLTSVALADNVGISRQSIYMLEKNEMNPAPKTALKISEVLDVEFDSLFTIINTEEGE